MVVTAERGFRDKARMLNFCGSTSVYEIKLGLILTSDMFSGLFNELAVAFAFVWLVVWLVIYVAL